MEQACARNSGAFSENKIMRNSAESHLLCSFTTLKEYVADAMHILNAYNVDGGKIYALQNIEDVSEIFLTYNIEMEPLVVKRSRTISVHRKRDFNVIYSINALNLIIQSQNGKQEIDWSNYSNSLVVAYGRNIEVIPTRLLTILRKN